MYVTIPIEVDDRALADDAVESLQTLWPDWEPNDGDFEVVLIETLSSMAADAAAAASQVPDAVFEAICEDLHGIVRRDGTPAIGLVTIAVEAGGPATPVPQGSEIDIDGWAFTTDFDVIASPTATGVPVTAVVASADANDLTGDNVSMVTALAPIVSVTLDEPTSGGADEETLQAFRERAVLELQLQGTTLVTARDYELMSLSQPYVGRVMVVSDPTTRTVHIYALNPDGTTLSTAEKNQLKALLNTYRETNWTITVDDPTISLIDVTYGLVVYPGNVVSDVIAQANAALTAYLDPMTWGQPTSYGEPVQGTWLVETTVRKNKIIDLLGNVPGVNYVASVTLGGTNGAVQGNGDFLMTGAAPLAQGRTLNGSATTS